MIDQVKEAFNKQSEVFDSYEEHSEILKRMRATIRSHLIRHLKTGSNILELNAGTGLDAVFLAEKGFYVHAIDISDGMLRKLDSKINSSNLRGQITYELLSYTELDKLKGKTFDYIFSNFGGLNCVKDLKEVTIHFKNLLKPDGMITLVIMPPVCPCELSLIFKGQFKQAFRRLHKNGTEANIEGIRFSTYYHSLGKLINALGKEYKLIEAKGIAIFSPPPYAEKFPNRHPLLYKNLNYIDDLISHTFPFNRWADHYIATFRFKPQ